MRGTVNPEFSISNAMAGKPLNGDYQKMDGWKNSNEGAYHREYQGLGYDFKLFSQKLPLKRNISISFFL